MVNLVTMIFGVYSIYVLMFHICIYIFIFYQEFLYTLVELFGIILELRRTALSGSEVVFCIMGIYKTPLTWRLVHYNRSHSILILIRPYIGFAHFCLSSSLTFISLIVRDSLEPLLVKDAILLCNIPEQWYGLIPSISPLLCSMENHTIKL